MLWTEALPLMSGLGLDNNESSFEIIKIMPTSFPFGPVTEARGLKALNPSISTVSAFEWEV